MMKQPPIFTNPHAPCSRFLLLWCENPFFYKPTMLCYNKGAQWNLEDKMETCETYIWWAIGGVEGLLFLLVLILSVCTYQLRKRVMRLERDRDGSLEQQLHYASLQGLTAGLREGAGEVPQNDRSGDYACVKKSSHA
ncbi:leukocyte-specific transcript 1 protein [Phascolarctos cinereus]